MTSSLPFSFHEGHALNLTDNVSPVNKLQPLPRIHVVVQKKESGERVFKRSVTLREVSSRSQITLKSDLLQEDIYHTLHLESEPIILHDTNVNMDDGMSIVYIYVNGIAVYKSDDDIVYQSAHEGNPICCRILQDTKKDHQDQMCLLFSKNPTLIYEKHVIIRVTVSKNMNDFLFRKRPSSDLRCPGFGDEAVKSLLWLCARLMIECLESKRKDLARIMQADEQFLSDSAFSDISKRFAERSTISSFALRVRFWRKSPSGTQLAASVTREIKYDFDTIFTLDVPSNIKVSKQSWTCDIETFSVPFTEEAAMKGEYVVHEKCTDEAVCIRSTENGYRYVPWSAVSRVPTLCAMKARGGSKDPNRIQEFISTQNERIRVRMTRSRNAIGDHHNALQIIFNLPPHERFAYNLEAQCAVKLLEISSNAFRSIDSMAKFRNKARAYENNISSLKKLYPREHVPL